MECQYRSAHQKHWRQCVKAMPNETFDKAYEKSDKYAISAPVSDE
jgi:hypothetical protein